MIDPGFILFLFNVRQWNLLFVVFVIPTVSGGISDQVATTLANCELG